MALFPCGFGLSLCFGLVAVFAEHLEVLVTVVGVIAGVVDMVNFEGVVCPALTAGVVVAVEDAVSGWSGYVVGVVGGPCHVVSPFPVWCVYE